MYRYYDELRAEWEHEEARLEQLIEKAFAGIRPLYYAYLLRRL